MGQSPPSRTYNDQGDGLPFFQGKAEFGELYPSIAKYCSEPKKVAQSGATLLSVRAPVGPTNLAPEECCIGRGLAAIHPEGPIDPKFVLYLFRAMEPDLSSAGTGSTFKAISKSFLQGLEVDLPPLAEQHRLVAKIEELLSELDKGVESLQTAQAQLEVYRQALLKHAFEGKLTADWREKNPDRLETAEETIRRVTQARQATYEEQVEAWKRTVAEWEADGKAGRKPSKPRVPKRLSPLDRRTRNDLPDAPEGWAWDRLGWMTCGVEYGTSAKSAEVGRVTVLRMGNLQNARLDWSDLAYTSDEDEIARYQLRAGDVLFNRTNSPELVGKTAIYRGERDAIFAGYLIRVNHMPSVVDGQYLNLFLNSYVARRYGNEVKTDGVNQSNINGQKLMGYPFPYCSIEEQREVVRLLDEKLSLIDKTDAELGLALRQASQLRYSILARAFRGELTPQDPNDEPASVLLERIRAGRDAETNSNKKRKAAS